MIKSFILIKKVENTKSSKGLLGFYIKCGEIDIPFLWNIRKYIITIGHNAAQPFAILYLSEGRAFLTLL
jgi:hypothetical protein